MSLEQLSSFLDGEILESSAGPIRTHVEQCVECRLRLTALRELDAVLARELAHDPSAQFLERLPREIERRAGIKGDVAPRPVAPAPPPRPVAPAPPPHPVAPAPPRTAPPKSTERIAPAEARTARAVPQRTRSTARRSGSSRPWIVGVTLLAIGAAVGIVIAPRVAVRDEARTSIQHPEPAPAEESKSEEPKSVVDPGEPAGPPIPDSSPVAEIPPPAPEIPAMHETAPKPVRTHATKPVVAKPEKLVPDLSGNFVPVKHTITVTETLPTRPQVTTQRPPRVDLGPFAKAPAAAQPLVLDAARAAQKASLDPSAANFDLAAAGWERVIPSLEGTAQQSLARQRVADARFQAWKADPTASRSATAIAALRRFIVFAPDGPAREAARAELARMSR